MPHRSKPFASIAALAKILTTNWRSNMKSLITVLILSLGLIAVAYGPHAQAAAILQPTSATTNMGSFNTFEPVYAIDQSGLSVGYVSGVTDFDSYVASTNTVNGGSSFTTWFSAAGNTTGNFDFNLGSLLTIESFALWADPQSANQGVNSFNLLADDNAAFTSPTLLGNYSAVDGLGNANNFGQTFGFAPTTASHVRMQIREHVDNRFR